MKSYLINTKEWKVIEILELHKTCSAKDIAEHMGVTPRTVLNYISNLNELMGEDMAAITLTKNRKYVIDIRNPKEFQRIINGTKENNLSIPEDRIKEILNSLLEAESMVKIDDLAESLYISRTTLIKDLKKISGILKNYKIKLQGKPNGGIEVIGSEMNIRFCISQVLYRNGEKALGLSTYEEIVENILKKIFKNIDFKVPGESFRSLILHTSIAVERYEMGKCIKEIPEKLKEIEKTKEYLVSILIKEELKKEIGIDLPEKELMYICLHLLGRKPMEELMESETYIEIKPIVKTIVSNMLDEIHKATGIFMKDDKELIWGLELHLNFAVNRLMFNMNISNPLLLEVKKKFPLAYQLAVIGAAVVEKHLEVKVNEHEISYIAMHLGSYIERNNYKYKDIQRVALICGTGLGTAQLMLVKIKKVLGELQQIKTFSSSTLDPSVLDGFDIVFTTIDLDINTATPVIKLDVLFDERELQDKIAYRNLKQEISKDNLYMFKKLISKELFFKIKEKTPGEIIQYMAQKCIEEGKADEGFVERLLEREQLSSTAFDNLIALPHAINYKSNHIEIAVGILEKTVKWDDKPIQIVFMVMVPNEIVEDANLFIKAYEDILKVGQNKNLLQKMVKAKDFEEFLSLF